MEKPPFYKVTLENKAGQVKLDGKFTKDWAESLIKDKVRYEGYLGGFMVKEKVC